MLVIRLFRVGKKNQPCFKIVVIDKRKAPRSGVFVEEVGFWDPLTKQRVLKKERIQYWLSVGAKPSDTIYNMLVSEGILKGKKVIKHKKAKKKEEGAVPEKKAEAVASEEKKEEVPTQEAESTPKEEKKQEAPKEEKPVLEEKEKIIESDKKEEAVEKEPAKEKEEEK